MILNPASIRLLPPEGPTPHSYAFNCDGLTTLEGQWGAHTQIWNGANGRSPVPLENQLINANYGQRLSNTTAVKVSNQSDYARDIGIDAYQLWDLGSGYVRVMQPMPL
jgi:hypothetical protein